MISEPIKRLDRLRAGTRDAHALIEAIPAVARLLATDLTRNEYVTILQHMHAFHAHVEPVVAKALASWHEAATMLDGSGPRALAEDLAWFGASSPTPPRFPALDGPPAGLGALYVIEGSALGARVIARHLANSIGVTPGRGGSFYCRQDAETARRRWQRVIELLESPSIGGERQGTDATADERIVKGAQETFRYLARWLQTIELVSEDDHAFAMAEAVAP